MGLAENKPELLEQGGLCLPVLFVPILVPQATSRQSEGPDILSGPSCLKENVNLGIFVNNAAVRDGVHNSHIGNVLCLAGQNVLCQHNQIGFLAHFDGADLIFHTHLLGVDYRCF